MAIVAGAALTGFQPSVTSELTGAAQIVVSDLAYARNLAVSNNSSYRVTFDVANELFYLEHSGTNAVLDNLPESPFGEPTDPPTRQTTDLAGLPLAATTIDLFAVHEQSTLMATDRVEFGSLGETTLADETVIWLAAGDGDSRTFIPVTVNPVTGLAEIGELQTTPPPAS